MKKFLLFVTILLCTTLSHSFAAEPNNGLLSDMYEKIDALYDTNPKAVLTIYHRLPIIQVKYANNSDLMYYIEKIKQYVHGKLFTFEGQANFVCRSDYVQVGDTVEIDLTMKKVDGTLIQTSVEEIATAYGRTTKQVNDVLAFNPGRGQVIRGLDELTLGAKLGQHKGALIDSHDAYGAYQSDKIVTFSTSSLPAEIQVADKGEKVLMFVEIDGEEKLVLGTVTDKTSTSATVDFNHMLAGEDLVIYIHIMKLFKVCK